MEKGSEKVFSCQSQSPTQNCATNLTFLFPLLYQDQLRISNNMIIIITTYGVYILTVSDT